MHRCAAIVAVDGEDATSSALTVSELNPDLPKFIHPPERIVHRRTGLPSPGLNGFGDLALLKLGCRSSAVVHDHPLARAEFTKQPTYVSECGTRLACCQKATSLARSRPTMNNNNNKDDLSQSDCPRFREFGEFPRSRNSLNFVWEPFRTTRPCLNRTSFTPWDLCLSPPFLRATIRETRAAPGNVRNAFPHFRPDTAEPSPVW
jgi:hypothetical protein